jgi:hypothetical protein
VTAATPTATRPAAGCAGDCDASGGVAINEVVTLVAVALGQMPIAACEAGNTDGNQQITINELLTAVNHSLVGCAPPAPRGLAGH